MNIPKSIETALRDVITAQNIGPSTTVRCWHNLLADPKWSYDEATQTDRKLPCVDIRCSPTRINDDQVTFTSSVSIECVTAGDDDRDHAVINAIEEAVQTACDTLFSEFKAQSGDTWTTFKAALEADNSGLYCGGIEFGEPVAPMDGDGLNTVGIGLVIHLSRSDF